ncbi:MAG TPA: LysM domain-containing protein [Solirubrobacterales bacterium]|nr:LysM domain-containing protein [Solirubrobacterales bacterium]
MPWFHELLTSISCYHPRSRPRLAIRAIAAALSVVLVFGAVTPGFAFASEADSEQEGSAPPGALPGLEEGAEIETAEETVLEEPSVPGATTGGEEGAPLETEPPQETEPPPPPPEAPAAVAPVSEEPPPGPDYSPAAEPATGAAPAVPVENEPLPAPETPQPAPLAQPEAEAEQAAPEAPPPVSPPEAPEPTAAQPPAVPIGSGEAAGSLAGQSVHVVKAGECLWSIAEALLPSGADNAEIETEVQRLWRLNAGRIGTGDPSLVYAGTELRLR